MLAERKAEAVERYRKKDMLQTVDTLLRANDAILKTVRSNPQGATEALVQCQESAITLGTYIDTLDEKYSSLVHVLEDYCENIYQMSENLTDENLCRKVSKKIQKQLTGLQNSIKYDLPEDRKEVVFLPYKASMWDSLESVWKAADADENTDAYVIPIPYFDKNPDGTFREEHYEGDQYPKYVPVTRYDEYDLKTRRPDVIYIHNPYDECNHVTSVHPYFYSKNLRNFTDKLVYIPYFILGEIEPDNQAAIESMKHFCFTPGTIYADQVIVQSENMRQIYINEYMKAAKEMGLPGEHVDRKFLEKKFLGTGSPKIDKVLNTRKEDLEIPAEWLRIIEKPDGSWKKIVFYNTSVSALLTGSEEMIEKMKDVFCVFKENQDKVALLWRPHPLIKATISSMRPRLWQEYEKIVANYRAEGWGIYDDSADMDRAVVLSDAYYGDASSAARIYKATGKPILFQNVNITSNREKIILSTYNYLNTEDYIYFAAKNTVGLFQYERKTGKIRNLDVKLNINTQSGFFLFGGVCECGKNVIFAPFLDWNLLIYDRNGVEDIKQINLKERFGVKKPLHHFYKRAITYKNLIYLIGDINSETIVFNTNNMALYELDICENMIMKDRDNDSFIGINTCGDICRIDNTLWVPLNLAGYILEINLDTKSGNCHYVGNYDNRFSTICYDGKYFWLTGYKKEIVKWDRESGRIEIINDFPKGFDQFIRDNYWTELFTRSFFENGNIYLFPMTANMAIRINIQTNEMQPFYVWEELSSCYTVEKWNEDTFYIEWGDRDYIEINHSMLIDVDGDIKETDVFVMDRSTIEWPDVGEGIYWENSAWTVERFIQDKIKHKSQDCETSYNKCGEKIFMSMR